MVTPYVSGGSAVRPETTAAPSGSALALLRLPLAFTQDKLMTTDDFIKASLRRSQPLSLQVLQTLHNQRLLLPLFRITDTAVEGRRIELDELLGRNPRGWVMHAGDEGRLRDPADEGYNSAWPYEQPPDAGHGWVNGFMYSSWQLIDVPLALKHLDWISSGVDPAITSKRAQARRQRTLALIALSSRHLPSVLGRIRYPSGTPHETAQAVRFDIEEHELLALVRYPQVQLLPDAEDLLDLAHRDPLIKLWPLLRHSDLDGWEAVEGASLGHIWQRIAAEVLLQAQEELAEQGALPALPDLDEVAYGSPLRDRVNAQRAGGESLQRSLAQFSLSPHPHVLLLVEGQTEMLHLPRLLDLFGLDRPDRVRVQNCRSSTVNPQLISRYTIAPRLGKKRGDAQLLDVPPTALVIAMDPENRWETAEMRQAERLSLQNAIREEVEAQGGLIGDDDLDFLVTVRVWGDQTYELANFTDEELGEAFDQMARTDQRSRPSWRDDLQRELGKAREAHQDIKVAMGALQLRRDKLGLAELLWPTLRDKCEQELGLDQAVTPVLDLLDDVHRRCNQLSASPGLSVST